jgi:DNA (cytosine-5)-methyltransferase 1
MKKLTHGSLFTGIGGFDLGFERAGFKTVWQVEIEAFPQAVLKTHWPKVQRYADVRKVGKRNLARVDVITAGVPCQDVSVAGKRRGLAGERTGLFYQFARILRELRPAWFVFENVPGLLSSNRGRDLAEVQRVLMVECGYGISRRVLDSQFFGVAQRRRRLFIVGSFGKPCPGEILFEPESRTGDSAPGGEAGAGVAYALAAGAGGSKFGSGRQGEDTFVAASITAGSGRVGSHDKSHMPGRRREDDFNLICGALQGLGDGGPDDNAAQQGHIVIQDVRGGTRDRTDSGQGVGIREGGPSYTLSGVDRHAVAFDAPMESSRDGSLGVSLCDEPASARRYAGEGTGSYYRDVCASTDSNRVRDFAGLPEGLDSARYRALGNAVTVQVAEWIARRIRASVDRAIGPSGHRRIMTR